MSSEHVDSVVSMFVDDSGIYGGGSDHIWIYFKMADKFRRLVRFPQIPVKKDIWDIAVDQDWTAFREKAISNLPTGDISLLSIDELS